LISERQRRFENLFKNFFGNLEDLFFKCILKPTLNLKFYVSLGKAKLQQCNAPIGFSVSHGYVFLLFFHHSSCFPFISYQTSFILAFWGAKAKAKPRKKAARMSCLGCCCYWHVRIRLNLFTVSSVNCKWF